MKASAFNNHSLVPAWLRLKNSSCLIEKFRADNQDMISWLSFVRVGKEIKILWNPTTTGTVSIRASSSSSTTVTTIAGESSLLFRGSHSDKLSWCAENITNSGTFAWTPASDLSSSSSTSTAGSQYTLEIIDDASQQVTSTSPSINLLLPSYETVLLNVNEWMYPVVGKPVTIQWSPSNATSISI
jgi:hypothetical protein